MVACHTALISREDRAWRRPIDSSTARCKRNKENSARGHAACLARSLIVRIERTGTFEKSPASGIRVRAPLPPDARPIPNCVVSAADREDACGVGGIEQGATGRGERVPPPSIAGFLSELPDGLIRLRRGGKGRDDRAVIPLINDVDVRFFYRLVSPFDKFAHVRGPHLVAQPLVMRPRPIHRDVELYGSGSFVSLASVSTTAATPLSARCVFDAQSRIMVQRPDEPLKIVVVIYTTRAVAVSSCNGWRQRRRFRGR